MNKMSVGLGGWVKVVICYQAALYFSLHKSVITS